MPRSLSFASLLLLVLGSQACERQAAPAIDSAALTDASGDASSPEDAANATSFADTNDATAGTSAYATWCSWFENAYHKAGNESCCGQPAAKSASTLCTEEGKWASLALAADKGHLTYDAILDASCKASLGDMGTYCSKGSVLNAFLRCMYSWLDIAALNQDCATKHPLSCAGGKGRCVPKTGATTWTCVPVQKTGASCSKVLPCGMEDTCLSDATGSAKCAGPGTKCQSPGSDFLQSTCLPTQVCKNAVCEPDLGKPMGAACQVDADCAADYKCSNGKCTNRICGQPPAP